MKTILSLILSSFFFINLYSQTRLFEDIKNENLDSLKIIGMYYNWDANKTYENFNFYISDKKIIDSLIKNVEYGEQSQNISEHNNFSIIVTKGNKILDRWSLSPKYQNIYIKGQAHRFDISLLSKLANQYYFKYKWYKKEFLSKSEFDIYYNSKLRNVKTLFIYEPNFSYEGSFELEFPKNETFIHPKAIDEYLRPKIKKILKNEDFSISYALTEYNLKNRNQYTMTISGPQMLYNKLKEKKAKKSEWKPTKLEAQIFEIE